MRFAPLVTLLAIACTPKSAPPAAASAPPTVAGLQAPKTADELVQRMADLDFSALIPPVLRWDETPPLSASAEAPQRPLVLLVDFADTPFDRFAGEPDQGDKLAAFYQELLFDDAYQRVDTLSHYYAEQSGGAYHMSGVVLPPVHLTKSLGAYGAPIRPEGGNWRNDTDAQGLIEDALALAHANASELDWASFDRWDPEDFDGDGITNEPDGYLDHLIVVYAGKGQHSCQRHYKLDEKLNANVGEEVLAELTPDERACGDRIWPHRSEVTRREGEGPMTPQGTNADGGVPIAPDLWSKAYNMQCEYTTPSTFIHETGHSLGLPDVYSRTSSNSTGPWEVMSSTSSPSPQNLSAWGRLMLGWLKPQVIVPAQFGGPAEVTVNLGRLDAPGAAAPAALIVLPPAERVIDLTELGAERGKMALYSGQGNDMDRSAAIALDLPDQDGLTFAFDAWWQIEAAWDFAYVEVKSAAGTQRIVPTDRSFMPAQHGHDGPTTLPGLTGRSGDADGDGKNESVPECDPTAKVLEGEDKVASDVSPCERSTWVRPSFDLSPWRGQHVTLRVRYFTDGAAVENGLLIDNVAVGSVFADDFEDGPDPRWVLDGFTPSTGHHTVLVPRYDLLEVRDPYAATEPGHYNYDSGLAKGSFSFYWDGKAGELRALETRPRAGVVAWSYNGAYPWSENDPSLNGPGLGYLLTVDSNPSEVALSGLEAWYQGKGATSHYDVSGEDAQAALREGFYRTLCAVRDPAFYPPEGDAAALKQWCAGGEAPIRSVRIGEDHALFGQSYADILPGEARDGLRPVGELYDFRERDGKLSYRMADRSLRYLHTLDAPFATKPFDDGFIVHRVVGDHLEEVAREPIAAVSSFSDADPAHWLNPKLPFGGVALLTLGLSWQVQVPATDAPAGTAATVSLRWTEPTATP